MVGTHTSFTKINSKNSIENAAPILDMIVVDKVHDLLGDKFGEMIEIYIKNSAKYTADIMTAMQKKNIEDIVIPSHTLKSISKQIGAILLSEIAENVEDMVRNSQMDSAESIGHLSEIIDELEPVVIKTIEALDGLNI